MSGREWWREAENAEPESGIPARWEGEGFLAYLERIAVSQGWMSPVRTRAQRSETGPAREPGQEG